MASRKNEIQAKLKAMADAKPGDALWQRTMQLTGKACEIKSQVGRRSNTIELTHPRHSDFF